MHPSFKQLSIAVFVFSSLAHATVTYTTGATTANGLNVNASAVFTTGANSVTIQLVNSILDPTSTNQNITGIEFSLKNGSTYLTSIGASPVTGYSGSGMKINAAGGMSGAAVTMSALQADWTAGYMNNALKEFFFGASGSNMQDYTVIGGAGANNKYDGTNGAFNNNMVYLSSGSTFTLTVFGALSTSTVSNVKFLFGSNAYAVAAVPEPATAALLCVGLFSAILLGRRRW